jgi:hypothetical protein
MSKVHTEKKSLTSVLPVALINQVNEKAEQAGPDRESIIKDALVDWLA